MYGTARRVADRDRAFSPHLPTADLVIVGREPEVILKKRNRHLSRNLGVRDRVRFQHYAPSGIDRLELVKEA